MTDFYAAGSIMEQAISTVTEKLDKFDRIIDRYDGWLRQCLADLSHVVVDEVPPPPELAAPDLPSPSIVLDEAPSFDPPALNLPEMPAAPSLDDLLSQLDLPDLDELPAAPAMLTLDLPAPPGMTLPEKPAAPDVDATIPLPDEPVFSLPEMEALTEIHLPDFDYPTIPDFDGQPPEFTAAVPEVFINWSEPEYHSELLDELLAEVRRMMAGGTGLHPAIEDALFSRARERDAAETRRVIDEAFATWAARDFSMPPGMLVAAVDRTREEGRLKAAETNRDVLVQAAQWEIENLRFAVTQGIALEGLLQNLFTNTVNRLFEAAKFQAESLIAVFNAQVALFNARTQAFSTLVEVFKTKLAAATAKISVYKTLIDAQVAIGQINVQRVEVFKARLEGVRATVDVFKARMEGARIRADVLLGQFGTYREQVQAYAAEIGAEKVKFDAYEAQIRGETAKATMFEANARAFAATIDGLNTKAEIHNKRASLRMDAAKLRIEEFVGKIDAYKAQLAASLQEMTYLTQVFQARIDGWKAKAGVAVAESEVNVKFAEMTSRTNVAYAEMKITEYQAKVQRAIQTAQIALEAAKALGSFAAQLAAGAMSAAHISASIDAKGSASSSYNDQVSTSHNYQYNMMG